MEAEIIKLKEDETNPGWYWPILQIKGAPDTFTARSNKVFSRANLMFNFGLTDGQILDLKNK